MDTPLPEAVAVLLTAPGESVPVTRRGAVVGRLDYATLRAHTRSDGGRG